MTVPVTVKSLLSIALDPSAFTLIGAGQARQLTVIGTFSDNSTTTLTSGVMFSSDTLAVATVSDSGLVTSTGVGSAVVTATFGTLAPARSNVTVTVDTPPTADILSPADGAQVERGDTVSVSVQTTDQVGVTRVALDVSGETTFSEIRQISPAATSTLVTFSFVVSNTAAVGGSISVTAQATDTINQVSAAATRTLTVVDHTAPAVNVTAPAPNAPFNFGDTVNIDVAASDAVGVDRIRFQVSGAFTTSGSQTIAPATQSANAHFQVTIPFGLTSPGVSIRAFARDPSGNESASAPVTIEITDADITPPSTIVTAVATPGNSASTVATYQVLDGLADLDHVELYFRRNGIGTFNRYTDAVGGNPNGTFFPQNGALGTITFDSTRMGGDGSYEFATVGVDRAGNREPLPRDANQQLIGDPGATATFATGVAVVNITSNTEISDASLDDQNLRISGATVTVVGAHSFRNVELLNGAVLTHRETTDTAEFHLDVNVWTLSIDAASRIDVTGRGYIGGRNFEEAGRTLGNLPGAGRHNGGSYGGLGGHDPSVAEQPNPVYGDLTEPLALGSGGGAHNDVDGGDGGGLVLIGSINLVVDGAIRADGSIASASRAGMGSGGGINVRTTTLSGRGTVEADGGTKNGADNVGGGGGRIAIRYLDLSTYDLSGITARGGDGFYADGADGTIFLQQQGATHGDLVINGQGASSPLTDLIIPPGQTFDSIILQNGANVSAQGAINLADTLRLRGNSRLTNPSESEFGLQITAAQVVVEAGSAIDVTGRGYRGGRSFEEAGRTLGECERGGAAQWRQLRGTWGARGVGERATGAGVWRSEAARPARERRRGAQRRRWRGRGRVCAHRGQQRRGGGRGSARRRRHCRRQSGRDGVGGLDLDHDLASGGDGDDHGERRDQERGGQHGRRRRAHCDIRELR